MPKDCAPVTEPFAASCCRTPMENEFGRTARSMERSAFVERRRARPAGASIRVGGESHHLHRGRSRLATACLSDHVEERKLKRSPEIRPSEHVTAALPRAGATHPFP